MASCDPMTPARDTSGASTPTDIAAVRALAEEAGRGLTLAALQAVAGGADRSFEMATLAQNTVREYHALATALRAACDEVEKLRGGACRHCGCIKPLEAP